MKRAVEVFESLNSRLGLLWAGVVLPLMLLTVIEVFSRYVLGKSRPWTNDLSIYLLVGMALLGGAYTHYLRGHVKVDILHSRFSPRARSIVDIVTSLMSLTFAAVLTWQGWVFAWRALTQGLTGYFGMEWPLFPLRFMVAAGGFLLCVQILCNIYHEVENLRVSRKEGKQGA